MKFKRTLILVIALVLIAFFSVPSLAKAADMSYGSVTGTGSYIYVSIGYTPRSIEVWSTSGNKATWIYGMPVSACMKTYAVDASGSLATYVAINTPCLKTFAGNVNSAPGFMIGIDSALFPTGTTLYWRTMR